MSNPLTRKETGSSQAEKVFLLARVAHPIKLKELCITLRSFDRLRITLKNSAYVMLSLSKHPDVRFFFDLKIGENIVATSGTLAHACLLKKRAASIAP